MTLEKIPVSKNEFIEIDFTKIGDISKVSVKMPTCTVDDFFSYMETVNERTDKSFINILDEIGNLVFTTRNGGQ